MKKGTDFELGDGLGVRGYKNFGEVSADLAEVMDVLWLSGTRESCLLELLCE